MARTRTAPGAVAIVRDDGPGLGNVAGVYSVLFDVSFPEVRYRRQIRSKSIERPFPDHRDRRQATRTLIVLRSVSHHRDFGGGPRSQRSMPAAAAGYLAAEA